MPTHDSLSDPGGTHGNRYSSTLQAANQAPARHPFGPHETMLDNHETYLRCLTQESVIAEQHVSPRDLLSQSESIVTHKRHTTQFDAVTYMPQRDWRTANLHGAAATHIVTIADVNAEAAKGNSPSVGICDGGRSTNAYPSCATQFGCVLPVQRHSRATTCQGWSRGTGTRSAPALRIPTHSQHWRSPVLAALRARLRAQREVQA